MTDRNNNDSYNNNNSCDLQLKILPMLAGIPDTDFTDNLTFWMTLTSGSGANKQRAWDDILYVDIIKTNLLSDCTDWLGPCTAAGSIRSTFCRLVTRAAVVQLRPLSRQRSHPNCGCSAPWCHYVSPSWLSMGYVDKQLTLSCCIASRAWRIQASIRDTAFWTTLCGGQWPERRYSLSRNPCVLITTVKYQMGLPWYYGRRVNVWLGVTVTDTYARSYIAQTKVRAGAAAERATGNKTNKYNYLLSNNIFIPLACEISGVFEWAGSPVE